MSAYILLDRMPMCCEECKFKDRDGDCILMDEAQQYDSLYEQAEHCPVRRFPEEKKRSYKKGYKSGYADGWDDCLEEMKEGAAVED